MRVDLPVFITLDFMQNDRIELTINDDLSGLIQFRAIAIGKQLILHEDDK